VIVGPDGAAWVTEGGQNAIARGWILRPAPSQQKFVNRKNPQVRFACTLARTFVLHRELSFACRELEFSEGTVAFPSFFLKGKSERGS
jgi:hypothetical protein